MLANLDFLRSFRMVNGRRRFSAAAPLETLEQRIVPAWTGTVTGAAISLVGDGGNDSVTLSVVGGNLQHNIPLSQGFASNQDFDNTLPGVQSVSAATLASLTIDGGAGTNTVSFNGATAHVYTAATLVSVANAGVTVVQSLTLPAGQLQLVGTNFSQSAGAAIDIGAAVSLDFTGTITVRDLLRGSSASIVAGGGGVNAIQGSVSTVSIQATSGDLTLQATAANAGINLSGGLLSATGDVLLSAGTGAISLLDVSAGGEFTSSGTGSFMANTGGTVTAAGPIELNHTGTFTFRSSVTGSAILVTSGSTSSNAILGNVAAAQLEATSGNIELTITATGGINFSSGLLKAAEDVILTSGTGTTAVFNIDAEGDFISAGGGSFSQIAGGTLEVGGILDLNHSGTVTFRGDTTAGSIKVQTTSTSANALFANSVAGATLTTTVGDLELLAPVGSVNFANGSLSASGSINLAAGVNVQVKSAVAGGSFSSSGSAFTAPSGSVLSITGPLAISHTGLLTFNGPVTAQSIEISTTSTSTNALRALGTAATLTSTAGDITLNSGGGVTLQGTVTVNGAPVTPTTVTLNWGAVTDLPNGVLGFDRLFAAHGAVNPLAINGAEVIYENPSNSGFDVGIRLVSPNAAQTGNTGSLGGALTSGPLTTPHIYFNPWSGSNNTFYLEIAFYETGTAVPVDVLGLQTAFEDVERGASTREWLMGPKYKTSAGDEVILDFSTASGFSFPTEAPPASLAWMVKEVELITTFYGETVYRAVPWYPIANGTQGDKNILLDLAATPLSYFRIGTSKTGNGGSWLMSGLGNLQLANSSVTAPRFSSTGVAFSSVAINVGQTGTIELNHSGAKSVSGQWDAGNYEVNGNGALNFAATGGIAFYLNVNHPPSTALLIKAGTGNIVFNAGSTVEIKAEGDPTLAASGVYTLIQNSGGGTVTGTTGLVTSGAGAAAITGLNLGAPASNLAAVTITAA